MEDYKSNSHISKENQQEQIPEKKVEKVITGSAKYKKKGEIQKFAGLFLPEDVSSIKSYIIFDVVVPLIKKALSDTVDAFLYPGEGRSNKNSTAAKISYNRCYDKPNERSRDYNYQKAKSGFNYDDIIFDNRGDAEAVLDAMIDIINQYGVVSVGDLYDLSNVSTNNYASNKYGWTDISGGKVISIRDGYILKLPKALPLN